MANATREMIEAAFKVLPPDAQMGVGEMERVLNAALRARLSQAGAGGGVVVKPLEWSEQGLSHSPTWRAESSFGRYLVYMRSDNSWAFEPPGLFGGKIGFKSPNQAMAAAQADYEARIRSALAPSPSAGVALINEHLTPDFVDDGNCCAGKLAPVQPTASVEAVEAMARVIYESTEEILRPSFWDGWTLADFAKADKRTRSVHHVMARAVLASLSPTPAEDGGDATGIVRSIRALAQGDPAHMLLLTPDEAAAAISNAKAWLAERGLASLTPAPTQGEDRS